MTRETKIAVGTKTKALARPRNKSKSKIQRIKSAGGEDEGREETGW